MLFRKWFEAIEEFPGEFTVRVSSRYLDQPTLSIPGWGSIRLFYSGYGDNPYWTVHSINGERPGAGTVLYFAALRWVLQEGDQMLKSHNHKPTFGRLASDLTLSPDAIRARSRMQTSYKDYLMIMPHPEAEGVKVHRGDKTDWRRPATAEEATMWRLSKLPPFEFRFI